jgi:hypothetical protein
LTLIGWPRINTAPAELAEDAAEVGRKDARSPRCHADKMVAAVKPSRGKRRSKKTFETSLSSSIPSEEPNHQR